MKNSYKAASIGATLLLAASSQAGQFYLGGDGGVAFQQNTAVRDNSGFNGQSGDMKFNTGWRAGGVVGYSFCKYFSTEVDASVIYNRINQIGTMPFSSTTPGEAHLDEVPLLVNGVFTWPLGKFKPYVGVGLGAAMGIFDSKNIIGAGGNYSDTDYTLAYQGEVGFRYTIINNLDLGVAYKFVGTTDHDWKDNNISLKTDGTMTHTIVGTISYRF